MPKLGADYPARGFGEPDACWHRGRVWRLSGRCASSSRSSRASTSTRSCSARAGAGKELAARAVHSLSRRARGPFVARNAATIPRALVEAEVYGNRKDFPTPACPSPRASSAPRARARSSSTRSARSRSRCRPRSCVCSIAARATSASAIRSRAAPTSASSARRTARPRIRKQDFAARFGLRVELPPLDARREDIPLIARQLVLDAAERSPAAAGRFVRDGAVDLEPALVEHMLRREYPTNVRYFVLVLRESMAASREDTLVVSLADSLALTRARRIELGGPSARCARPARMERDSSGEVTRRESRRAHSSD